MKTIEQARAVSEEDKALLHEAKAVIKEHVPSAEVLLYGSVARGMQGPESDYDVLVLTETALSAKEEDRVRDAIYDLQLEEGKLISTFFCTRDFWDQHPSMPFHQEVDRDGILL